MYKVTYIQKKNINGNQFNETILNNTHQAIDSAAQELEAAHRHAKALGLSQGQDYEVQLDEV